MARLHEAGAEPVSGLVLPTGRFFPDRFDASLPAVNKLFRRILKHGGLSDVPAEVVVVGDDDGSCSSGACSTPSSAGSTTGAAAGPIRRIEEVEDGYRANVHVGEVKNATILTTALVRAAAFVRIREADYDAGRELDQSVDLAGVLLGFGVLLNNGAYIYQKGCGGVRVQRATRLDVTDLAVALAIFCKLHGHTVSELDPSAKDFFGEARRWADSNARTISLVASDRLAVEAGSYELAPARGWLSRLVGLGKKSAATAPDERELENLAADLEVKREQSGDDERSRRLAALRELVDEALER
jgi:hypothetical protein